MGNQEKKGPSKVWGGGQASPASGKGFRRIGLVVLVVQALSLTSSWYIQRE